MKKLLGLLLILLFPLSSFATTKFMEPGGDATFNAASVTGGFWGGGSATVVTDFVHGTHIKSLQATPGAGNKLRAPAGIMADSGSRASFYVYFAARPSLTASFFSMEDVTNTVLVDLRMTSAGVLQLWNHAVAQIGTNGSTLSTGRWYRISLAYTITSTTVNRFELFVDGVSSISITNATLAAVSTNHFILGNSDGDAGIDFRSSDIYLDNSSSLTDTGNIWVTAKRPVANGTTNGFSTQIGSGGSSYGSGHSPQVNERALSNTNGWSMVGAGSAVTEEYNAETKTTGDIDISAKGIQIIDVGAWADIKSLVGETINIILNGINFSQAITSTETLYTKFAGATSYPADAGTDIGVQTDTSLTTVSLYELGVLVAYIPATDPNRFSLMGGTFLLRGGSLIIQ